MGPWAIDIYWCYWTPLVFLKIAIAQGNPLPQGYSPRRGLGRLGGLRCLRSPAELSILGPHDKSSPKIIINGSYKPSPKNDRFIHSVYHIRILDLFSTYFDVDLIYVRWFWGSTAPFFFATSSCTKVLVLTTWFESWPSPLWQESPLMCDSRASLKESRHSLMSSCKMT